MVNRYAQWLQAGSYAASVDRRLIGALWPGPASAGCAVTPATAMTVNVAIGQVAVPSQNSTGSTLCSSDATDQVTLTQSNGTNPRIDLVTCHPRGNDLDGGANNDFIFDFVTGTPAASPTVPATPAGQVALAQILVGAGVAAITAGNITDVRPGGLAIPSGTAAVRASARYGGGGTSSATSNTLVPVTWSVLAFDDQNAVSGTTWTCKVAGVYTFSFQVGVNTSATNSQTNLAFFKNGTQVLLSALTHPTAFSERPAILVDRCVVGDTMTFQFSTTQTSLTLRGGETMLNVAYQHP